LKVKFQIYTLDSFTSSMVSLVLPMAFLRFFVNVFAAFFMHRLFISLFSLSCRLVKLKIKKVKYTTLWSPNFVQLYCACFVSQIVLQDESNFITFDALIIYVQLQSKRAQ